MYRLIRQCLSLSLAGLGSFVWILWIWTFCLPWIRSPQGPAALHLIAGTFMMWVLAWIAGIHNRHHGCQRQWRW
jgi:hypothetical protein